MIKNELKKKEKKKRKKKTPLFSLSIKKFIIIIITIIIINALETGDVGAGEEGGKESPVSVEDSSRDYADGL